MSQLLRFPPAVKRDPDIDVWMSKHSDELGAIAHRWFEVMRGWGDDVRELLHDGHPTACVDDVPRLPESRQIARIAPEYSISSQEHCECEDPRSG